MSQTNEEIAPYAEVEREETESAFRQVMATATGKRVMFWLLERTEIYRDAFSQEPGPTNYMLGRQSIGRILISKLDELDPKLYPRLLLEIADMKELDRVAARSRAERKEPEDEDFE